MDTDLQERVAELRTQLLSALSWHPSPHDEGLMSLGKIINTLSIEDHTKQSLHNAYVARAGVLNRKRAPEPTIRLD